MKFIVHAILIISLSAQYAAAQITLTQIDYPASVIGTDSLKKALTSATYPPLTSSAGGLWDMSTVADTAPNYFAFYVSSPTYQFGDSNNYMLGLFNYSGNIECNITSSGYISNGKKVYPVNYSLTSLTTGPTDSLFINAQTSLFTSPHTKIKFPATAGTFWSSAYNADLAFEISVAMAGFAHSPGFVRTYTSVKDTVAGWGKMRVKDAAGSPSAYLDVLQVQSQTTTIDSFFINSLPAPNLVLSTLGLTQGKKDTVYEHYYYRKGEVTPLARVRFRDAAYTQPMAATTHTQRLTQPAAIGHAVKGALSAFPNPAAAGNTLTVTAGQATGPCHYRLVNSLGQQVAMGNISLSAGSTGIQVPMVAAGLYTLSLTDGDGLQHSALLEIVK